MNLIRVSRPVSSLKRILQPTSRPHVTPSSSATRHAHGGDAAGLGAADPASIGETGSKADLRKLGGFPRPGFAANHHDLVGAHGGEDVLAPGANREIFWKLD